MTTKHTPGPWEAVQFKDDPSYIASGEYTIATMSDLETDENEANARLIAAAPDLLEACKLLAATEGPTDVMGAVFIESARSVARAAIRKATQ